MIFRKSLLRELATVALGVFLVLLAITITTQVIRFLGQAASGLLAVDAVLALLGFSSLNYLPVLLSLTLFISVLMTLTRSYRDSEMVVWFCSGVGLTAWIRPVLKFGVPLVITIALLSLVLSPWALAMSEEYKRQLDSRDDVAMLSPGVFRESKQAERVYFVEHVDGVENVVQNIFVSSTEHHKDGVMVARRGFQETKANGDRFLVLLDGKRYEGPAGSAEYRVVDFERYSMRIETFEARRESPSAKSMTTLELLRQRTPIAMGELTWRIGLPVAALILALLAIPLSFVNPRAGRSLNLVLALLVYMTYSNCLSIAQAWVAQERISVVEGLWGVHAAMLAVLLLLFYRRLAVFSLFRLFR
ncbi:MAG TPA: LPS export ABC transporter permease LptF [Burkholderiales bacterium]|nr:LPS export ABC transporter permease LptF [Burkholderiales bacterium]